MRSPAVLPRSRIEGACHPPVSPAWHDQGVPLVFGILVSAAVIFAVFAVTVGRGGSMTQFAPDRPGRPLPEDRRRARRTSAAARFSLAFRGYRMAEVDDALDRLALEIAERDEAIEKLTGQPFDADPPAVTVRPRWPTGGLRAGRYDPPRRHAVRHRRARHLERTTADADTPYKRPSEPVRATRRATAVRRRHDRPSQPRRTSRLPSRRPRWRGHPTQPIPAVPDPGTADPRTDPVRRASAPWLSLSFRSRSMRRSSGSGRR